MNDPFYNQLRELSWRRKLTGSEEADLRGWLASHTEAQTDWELEAALNEALGRLPNAPLASNFTNRLLEAVELEKAAGFRRRRRLRTNWWQRLVLRTGLAGLVGGVGFFSYQQLHQARVRTEVRQSVVVISAVSSLPSPDILENFDAIRVSAAPAADEKLLTLLQ